MKVWEEDGVLHCDRPEPLRIKSGVVPLPKEVPAPGRYGPVRVLYDETYGGFLGYEFAGELYSSIRTLPPALRDIFGGQEPEPSCKNGHPRKAHGYFDGRGKQCCRVCDRERVSRHESRRRLLTSARHETQARELGG